MDLIAQICFLLTIFIVASHSLPDDSKTFQDEPGELKSQSDVKSVPSEEKSVPDETKSAADESELVADKSESVADKSELVADKSELVADKSESVADKSELVADKSELVADKSKTLPDPSVFVMKTPPGFINFFATNGESQIGKFPFWGSPGNFARPIKFPEWFQSANNKPETEIQVEKNEEKEQAGENKPENINIDWDEAMQDFVDNDPKDVFPSYYNVFSSNAYPSWVAFPGLSNGLKDKKKKSNGIEVKNSNLKATSGSQEKEDQNKLFEKKESNANGVTVMEKFSDISDDSLKLSKYQDPNPIIFPKDDEDGDLKIESKPVAKDDETTPLKNEDKSVLANIDHYDALIIPVQALLSRINAVQNQDTIPNNLNEIKQHQDDSKLQEPEKKLEPIVVSNVEDESEESKSDKGQNLMPDNFLYNLLQQAKPLISSISSNDKGSSLPSNSQIAAVLFPSKDPSKPEESRNILPDNGNRIPESALNNGVNLANLDKGKNERPLLNNNSPNIGPSPNFFQNSNPQLNPNNMPVNQGNIPNNAALNQYYPSNQNQGNIPVSTGPINAPANNFATPYNNVNQNNNYPQNLGQAVLVSLPYNTNNGATSYALVNPQQGNINSGQNLLQPQGQGYPISLNNNVGVMYPVNNNAGFSPGLNSGQNLYAIVPLTNGNVGNVNAVYGNSQPNPMYQAVNAPLYNLVPMQPNAAVLNTKDEEE